MKYVGIDPGLQGGIVTFSDDKAFEEAHVMPLKHGSLCVKGIKKIFEPFKEPAWIFVEEPFALRFQGLRGTMTMFTNYGRLLAALEDLELAYELIPPVTWQAFFGIRGTDRKTTKDQSIEICQNLYPSCNLLTRASLYLHDGIADAALIGTFGFSTRKQKN